MTNIVSFNICLLTIDNYCIKGAKDARGIANCKSGSPLSECGQIYRLPLGSPGKTAGLQGGQSMALQNKNDRCLAYKKLECEKSTLLLKQVESARK